MQGTAFTLARLKIFPTIKNLDFFFMIVRCDAVENYVSLRFTTGVSSWIVIWGSSQVLHVFTVFLTGV